MFSERVKNNGLVASLGTTLLGLSLLGAGALANNLNSSTMETHAIGAKDDTIFFTPSAKWAYDCDSFKLEWYKDSTLLSTSEMSVAAATSGALSDRTSYAATAPAAFDKIKIKGWKSGLQKYYSGDMTPHSTMRHIIMPYSCDWNDTWVPGDASGTVWANVDVDVKTTEQTTSLTTARIIMYNKGTHWETNNSYSPCAIRAWGGGASQAIGGSVSDASIYYLSNFNDDNGTTYYYADIPTDVTGFQFVKANSGVSTSNYDFSISYYSYNSFNFSDNTAACVYYAPGEGNTFSCGAAHDVDSKNVAGANLMTTLLAAYSTCSSSEINGWGAYENLNNNFYQYATNDAKNATVISLGGKTSFKVSDHMEGLLEGYTAGSRPHLAVGTFRTNTADSNVVVASVTIAAATLVVAIGLIAVRKRREA